jgi:hypothetical protein
MMRMLHFATNESWRSRGRYLLMGAGLKVVPNEDAVFQSLSPEAPQKSKLTNAMINDAFEKLGGADAVLGAIKEPAIPVATYNGPPKDLIEEREELAALVEKATGKKPHHFTGIDKLREMVQSLDQPQSV